MKNMHDVHRGKNKVIGKNGQCGDFPGGPVAKTALPMQGAWVQSLARELDPTYHDSKFTYHNSRSGMPQPRPSAAK